MILKPLRAPRAASSIPPYNIPCGVPMATHTIFLYGTLKRGEPNHHVLTKTRQGHARYLGRARTLHRWPLVVAGNLRIPYMLHCQDNGKNILGEVYEVDDHMLEAFDTLERHPFIYERDRIVVEVISEEDIDALNNNGLLRDLDGDDSKVTNDQNLTGGRRARSLRTEVRSSPYLNPPATRPRDIATNFTAGSYSMDNQSQAGAPQHVECMTYFMKRYLPELTSFPCIDDYKFDIHGKVRLPKTLTEGDIERELALVMKPPLILSKL